MDIQLEAVYVPSEDVVGREVVGEYIIVPLTTGIGDLEDELYTLNETGYEIWKRLDGVRSLHAVAAELALEYQAPQEEIEQDVLGLVDELVSRKILVEIDNG
ncbi:MAG: PqqD family protein [Chloroflexota bacterium]|nr:PqqD family protein [Chloroflexota bacterium]